MYIKLNFLKLANKNDDWIWPFSTKNVINLYVFGLNEFLSIKILGKIVKLYRKCFRKSLCDRYCISNYFREF